MTALRHKLGTAIVLLCVIGLTTSCSLLTPTARPTQPGDYNKTASKLQGPQVPRRTDIEPLVKRLPGLGSPLNATWYGGSVRKEDSRDFAPSSTFIDAVIEVEPEVAARLRELPDLTPEPIPQDLVPELEDAVPTNCTWLGQSKARLPNGKKVLSADLEQDNELKHGKNTEGIVVGQDCDFVLMATMWGH